MAYKRKSKISPENQSEQAAEESPKRKYMRRAKLSREEKFSILPELMQDSNRMTYNILLAMLLRENGRVEFTGKDVDIDDQGYNVVYALSLDGTKLEVQVVNSQSGILSTSVKKSESPTWQPPQVHPQSVEAAQAAFEVMQRQAVIAPMPPPPKADTTTSPPSSAFLSTSGPESGTLSNLNEILASLETNAKESQIEAEQAAASGREN